MKNVINTLKAPAAVGTYSQGVIYNGLHYYSGQIGLDIETGEMKKSFDDQLNQIMKNIDGLLESCSLTRDNIIKTTVFLTDLADFPKVNQAYTDFFTAPYPARSTIQVAGLPKGALVEIEVIAAK